MGYAPSRPGLFSLGVLGVATAAAAWFFANHQSSADSAAPRLLFLAPFWSGGGYASEATILAIYLEQQLNGRVRVRHHGDQPNDSFVAGLPAEKRDPLKRMLLAEHDNEWLKNRLTITICHSSAHAWDAGGMTSQWPDITPAKCPVPGFKDATYSVGRTMLEGSPLPPDFARRVQALDEIWVPSIHQKRVFEKSGVDTKKLIHIPESAGTARPLHSRIHILHDFTFVANVLLPRFPRFRLADV
jgi:hypothetical protein